MAISSKVRPHIFGMIAELQGKTRAGFEQNVQDYLSTLLLANETLNHQELAWLAQRLDSENFNEQLDDVDLFVLIQRHFLRINRHH